MVMRHLRIPSGTTSNLKADKPDTTILIMGKETLIKTKSKPPKKKDYKLLLADRHYYKLIVI